MQLRRHPSLYACFKTLRTFLSPDVACILPIQEAHVLVSGRSPVVGAILCMLALPVLIGRTNGLGDRLWVLGKS